MLNFFRAFPLREYQFQDDTNDQVFIVDISRNVRAFLDQMDNHTYYLWETVSDGSRPDQLSMKLYKTPNYWWTFFVINPKLSEGLHQWPKSSLELENYVTSKYGNRIALTPIQRSGSLNDVHLISNRNTDLVIGEQVLGFDTGTTAVVESVNHQLNQVIVKDVVGEFSDSESIGFITSTIVFSSNLDHKVLVQPYEDAVHHYIDSDGNWIDRLRFNEDDTELPVTNFDYELSENDSKMNLKVLNSSVVDEFATRYKKLINS
jgi:hypothetical protein